VQKKHFLNVKGLLNRQGYAEIILSKIEELSLIYEPEITIDVIHDKDDNKFLELAITANAQFLITGNKNKTPSKPYLSI